MEREARRRAISDMMYERQIMGTDRWLDKTRELIDNTQGAGS
jgi:hypothetical protein